MAAYLTLAQAKEHLRVPAASTDNDADINLKLLQAQAIVLNYLKDRPTTIASISVANPTVITTDVPHGLISGAIYTLSGTTSTPTVNGAQVVTVTGATTFTVPVNVTIGQASAAGLIATPAWTQGTVPGAVQAATLLALSHLYENRGEAMRADADLWEALGRLLCRYRDPALA